MCFKSSPFSDQQWGLWRWPDVSSKLHPPHCWAFKRAILEMHSHWFNISPIHLPLPELLIGQIFHTTDCNHLASTWTRISHPEDGGSMFFWNVKHTSTETQKKTIKCSTNAMKAKTWTTVSECCKGQNSLIWGTYIAHKYTVWECRIFKCSNWWYTK